MKVSFVPQFNTFNTLRYNTGFTAANKPGKIAREELAELRVFHHHIYECIEESSYPRVGRDYCVNMGYDICVNKGTDECRAATQ